MTEGELRAAVTAAVDAINDEYRKLLTQEDFMIPKPLTESEIEERAAVD